jgi:hypothetical protein
MQSSWYLAGKSKVYGVDWTLERRLCLRQFDAPASRDLIKWQSNAHCATSRLQQLVTVDESLTACATSRRALTNVRRLGPDLTQD